MLTFTEEQQKEIVEGILHEIDRLGDLPGEHVSITYEVNDVLKFEVESQRNPAGEAEQFVVVGIVEGIDKDAITIHAGSKPSVFTDEVSYVVKMCTYDA